MGMFNDNVNAIRTSWTYKYSGADLLQYAKLLLLDFQAKETEARTKVAEYMLNPSISHNDPEVINTKNRIEKFGKLKEECEVYVWEFKRNPDSIYELGLGDVTFFGLNKEIS